MRKGRIENWQEIELFGQIRVTGRIYECGDFEEGEQMFTSGISQYHTIMGQIVVETKSGSMYHLGTPAIKDRTLEEIMKDYDLQTPVVMH